jgi:uncharacterized protein with HEPN domain
MPGRAWKFRIEDILEAIEDMSRLTSGMTSTAHSARTARPPRQSCATWQLSVKLPRRVPADIALRHPQVPWREMGDMRNVVIHKYFGVDLEILWKTIHEEIPPLRPLLEGILKDEADS